MSTGNANTSSRVQLNRAARHTEWLTLFAHGMPYAAIAARYEVNESSVREVVRASLKDSAKHRRELADEALELQIQRLETILRAHMPIAVDTKNKHAQSVKSAQIVLNVLDRLAKLLGIDEPIRAEVTVRVRDELDDELHRLAKLIKDEAPAGAPTDVLDAIIAETEQLPAGE